MIFRQLQDKESSTFSYLLADRSTRQAVLIDPVLEQFERDEQVLKELNLKLIMTIETHVHADHVTSAGRFRQKHGSKVILGAGTGLDCADHLLQDGEILTIGEIVLRAIATPGHTNGCTTYFVKDRLFTGDALLIRGCGRTDFQEGSSTKLFESIRKKLFSFSDETLVYPGHDYKGLSCSSIGEEKAHNPRLGLHKTQENFVEIMKNLNLSYPKKIDEALPKNLQCGL